MTSGTGRIVVGPASAELRRSLRPIEWVVLEDVALDARPDGHGALVAATSARRVAERLGLTPGAAAATLARLRSVGLVTHARQVGPAGRFGLSAYVLGAVPGVEVLEDNDRIPPGVAPPLVAPPPSAAPCVVEPHMVAAERAEPPASSGGRPARTRRAARAAATSASASAVRDPAPARSGVDRTSAADAGRRPGRPPAAQLSMLDALAEPPPDSTPERRT